MIPGFLSSAIHQVDVLLYMVGIEIHCKHKTVNKRVYVASSLLLRYTLCIVQNGRYCFASKIDEVST